MKLGGYNQDKISEKLRYDSIESGLHFQNIFAIGSLAEDPFYLD